MSWTAPPTFVAGAFLTAAQMNIIGGDLSFLAGTTSAVVATSEALATSGSYGALTTAGPICSNVLTGANALVLLTATMSNTGSNETYMSFTISGATTLAAADNRSVSVLNSSVGNFSVTALVTPAMTAGTNTFTAQYRTNGGTGTWANRRMTVIPLP